MTTLPNEKLAPLLFEITTGILLGDGNLQKPGKCKHSRLRFAQNIKTSDYASYLFNQYKTQNKQACFISKPLIKLDGLKTSNYITPKHKKSRISIGFQTRISSAFDIHESIFYSQRNSKKTLTKNLKVFDSLLTPTALAYWYMNDGTCSFKNCRHLILCTHGYQLYEVEYFSNLLNQKFDLITSVRLNKKKPIIAISAKSFSQLEKLIGPIIFNFPSMQSKWPSEKWTLKN